jgi:hypothetical protein
MNVSGILNSNLVSPTTGTPQSHLAKFRLGFEQVDQDSQSADSVSTGQNSSTVIQLSPSTTPSTFNVHNNHLRRIEPPISTEPPVRPRDIEPPVRPPITIEPPVHPRSIEPPSVQPPVSTGGNLVPSTPGNVWQAMYVLESNVSVSA